MADAPDEQRATLIRRDPPRRRGRSSRSSRRPRSPRQPRHRVARRPGATRVPRAHHDSGSGPRLARRARVADSTTADVAVVPVPGGRLGGERRAGRALRSSPHPALLLRPSRSQRRSSSRSSTARSSRGRSLRRSPQVRARARSARTTSASEVQGLRALGPGRRRAPGASASLEDWGTLTVLVGDERQPEEGPARGAGVSHGASRAPDGGPRWPAGRERDRHRQCPGDLRRRS